MASNISEIFTAKPVTTFNSGDLFYVGVSPYGAGDDGACEYSTLIPLTTKGDIFCASATGATRLAAGSDGTLLRADSTKTEGLDWTAATYPGTTTANYILYSSANDVVGELTTANNGVLVTDGSGVPSISSSLPSAVQDNITNLGTISSIGAPLDSQYGGTGKNNAGAQITIGGDVEFSGAFPFTGTLTGSTSVTFPTSGTLATVPASTTTFASYMGDTGGNGFTLTRNSGFQYTIGQLVFFSISLVWSSKGSASAASDILIQLPFTCENSTFIAGNTSVILWGGITATTTLTAGISANSNFITIVDLNASGFVKNIKVSDCATSGNILLSGVYVRT